MLFVLPIIINVIAVIADSDDNSDFRIVGGKPVSIKQRPFQIAIYRSDIRLKAPTCGGSILNQRWILTAAHCVDSVNARYLYIRVGVDNLRASRTNQMYNIVKAIPHPYYSGVPGTMSNDIALLETKRDIEFGANVKPIRIRIRSPEPGVEAIVSGFGTTKEGNRYMSSILSQVSVRTVEYFKCLRLLAKASAGSLNLSGSHFCAADLAGGRDACQGDSGGPITIGNALAGIVSWGIGCAARNMPAFYTDVSQFVNWISTTMNIPPMI